MGFLLAPAAARAYLIIPDNQPPTLAHTADQINLYVGEQPFSWYIASAPAFKILYSDPDNDAPNYLNVIINGAAYPMARNANPGQCWLGYGPNGETDYLNCAYSFLWLKWPSTLPESDKS